MDAYNTPPWYYPMQPPHGMHQQHLPPMPHTPDPGPQGPPHPGMPMSPRTQSQSLPPSTPTMSDAIPSLHTLQPPPHSLLKSHVHPAQYVNGVRTSMRYLQTTCSVDLVIVLCRVDNTCHRSCDLVTCHTLCCI